MIYFRIAVLLIAALGLLIYALLFDRKYFFGLLIVEIICTGFLSFHIFYTLGSYASSASDIDLAAYTWAESNEVYSVNASVKWKQMPEIFGFNGEDDMMVIRYNPNAFELISADRRYSETDLGKTIVTLPRDFEYSKIGKSEKDIVFNIEDGTDDAVKLYVRKLQPTGEIKVFYLHDYKLPLDTDVYWERGQTLDMKY